VNLLHSASRVLQAGAAAEVMFEVQQAVQAVVMRAMPALPAARRLLQQVLSAPRAHGAQQAIPSARPVQRAGLAREGVRLPNATVGVLLATTVLLEPQVLQRISAPLAPTLKPGNLLPSASRALQAGTAAEVMFELQQAVQAIVMRAISALKGVQAKTLNQIFVLLEPLVRPERAPVQTVMQATIVKKAHLARPSMNADRLKNIAQLGLQPLSMYPLVTTLLPLLQQ